MRRVQFDEPPCARMSEDILNERTNSLRSLLKERLKKNYQDLDTTYCVPMKLHLFKGVNEEIKTEQVIKELKCPINDFLKAENVIEYVDLFKPCPITNKDVRTVLMKGIPGTGKTTAVKKFVLDWTEGRTHQDITFVLPFNLTELSLMKTEKCSLVQLLGLFFPELTDVDALQHAKVLFVLDDLSKCKLRLKFWHLKSCSDPKKELSLSALLVNLLRGDLFPKAQIWVTSSSQGADLIPSKFLQRVVEIQGLDDVDWEEYIRRLVRDCSVATRAINHVKSSNNLYFMRSLPVFCHIAATVLEELMTNACNMELPLTLTEMYTHYLLIQMRGKAFHLKAEAKRMKTDAEEILKLGKLAWHTLEKGSLSVFEEELRQNNIAPSAAAELSQRWTTFFKEEELIEGKVYHFAHQSIQSYLSALYVVVNYEPSKGNVLSYTLVERVQHLFKPVEATDMYRRAVDKTLRSKEGQFDFFLIFLLGISAGPSYEYLSCFLPDSCQRGSSENIVPYIFKNIENTSSLNLVRCLDELNVSYTGCQGNVEEDLTPSEWSAMAKTLLNSEDQERIFDSREYLNPEVAFGRLLPVIKASKVLRVDVCGKLCWMLLASALRSPSNSIREIDTKDVVMKIQSFSLLSEGLKSPNCKVEILRTTYSLRLEEKDPDPLISALLSNPSHLRELNLSDSYAVTDKTVEGLTKILVDPTCHLEKLVLASCSVKKNWFTALVSALSSNLSCLRELDLSYSAPGLDAFLQLCSLLKDSRFKLETLILDEMDLGSFEASNTTRQRLTDIVSEASRAMASALSSSNLRVLNFGIYNLEDSSVELLSAGLSHPACKLEILRMTRCKITDVGAAALANALRLNPSHMRELDLSYNPVEATGIDQLNSLVEDPAIKLEKIILEGLGEHRDLENLQQYEFSLTLDPNTASVDVVVSKGDKEAWHNHNRQQPVPENPERFKRFSLVMCREGLTGRHFCQVEWFGRFATIGVAYKDICRKGRFAACSPGYNKKSWAITVSTPFPLSEALHDGVKMRLRDRSPWRVGVYLDWSAGTLSFYDITNEKAELLHTFYAKFTAPLHLVFSMSAGIRLLPSNPGPVCCHDHDPWDMFRGVKDCKGCNGSKAG
ncbi:LOW QUALITY PROTEIN: protein NLRC3-like [Colossoma macropomum]|uniref:LOW QUALITY PROTEIN: protein NLRC3-like n=1 Tax=Colossoma macropomum TaxID=42526 RepID=UPI00186542EE|nr:LOW QUALITY PROTEIN: protein NLRC3-like [Colossoma macropomum]